MAGNDNWTEIVEWAEHDESWLKTYLRKILIHGALM